MSNTVSSKSPKAFFPPRSPSTQFQIAASPKSGNDFLHLTHPQHPVSHVILPFLFTCTGCKEYGAGRRIRCHSCEVDLHEFCSMAPRLIYNSLHTQHPLVFFTKPGGLLRSKCDICGKSIKGFGFRCVKCNFELHPCCATLRPEMKFPTHIHPLILTVPKPNGTDVCSECSRKRSGCMYHCTMCPYSLDAVCAKDMVNGLFAYGIKVHEKPNMLGLAARYASYAVKDIFGGLFEGIGEGIGEALFENIGRGKNKVAQDKQIDKNHQT